MNIDRCISTCKGHVLKLDKNRDSNHEKFIRYLGNSVFYLFIFNIGALNSGFSMNQWYYSVYMKILKNEQS